MRNIFKPDYENYQGVRRINIYVMRLFFALMFIFVAKDAWTKIITHKGAWDGMEAVVWCVWAAYATLAIFGVFHTLKMLPLMLFMVFYKGIWLAIVAYPLWRAGTFIGSSIEEMTYVFMGIIIPILFMPWKYVFNNYVRISTKKMQA